MKPRAYVRALLRTKAGTLLLLSFIWSFVSMAMIWFESPGAYAVTFIAGMFGGMAFIYPLLKGNMGERVRKNEIER